MKPYLPVLMILTLAGCATAPTATVAPTRSAMGVTTLRTPLYKPGIFTWPVRGDVIAPFGATVDKALNKGMDIRASEGSAVRAAKSGRVVYCDPTFKGYGKTVIIDHGNGYQTVYAYNSEILVKTGDMVGNNDIIAKVGRTGRAREASLHFEVRRNGKPENPAWYL